MLLFKAPWRAILIKFIVKLSFNGIFWKGRTQDPRSLTLVLIPLIGYRCFVLGSTSLPRGGAFAKTTTNLSSCVYWLATHPSKHLKGNCGYALSVLFYGSFGMNEMQESSRKNSDRQRTLLILSFILLFFGAKIYQLL